MKSLAADIRKLMLDRIQGARFEDLFAIASSLCANEPQHGPAFRPLATVANLPRFTSYDLHGIVVPSGGAAVYWAQGSTEGVSHDRFSWLKRAEGTGHQRRSRSQVLQKRLLE